MIPALERSCRCWSSKLLISWFRCHEVIHPGHLEGAFNSEMAQQRDPHLEFCQGPWCLYAQAGPWNRLKAWGQLGGGTVDTRVSFFSPMKFCLFIALSIASLYRCPSFSPVAAAAGQAVLREVQRQGGKAYAGPIVVWRNPVVMPGDIEVWQAMPWPEDGRASACTMFFRKPVD